MTISPFRLGQDRGIYRHHIHGVRLQHQETIKLELSGTDRMTAYNMSPVKISRLSGVQCDNIISYDARITNGTLTDLVRYVLDRQNHREMHQFLYYNVFGLPESISFPDWYSTVRNWRGILQT